MFHRDPFFIGCRAELYFYGRSNVRPAAFRAFPCWVRLVKKALSKAFVNAAGVPVGRLHCLLRCGGSPSVYRPGPAWQAPREKGPPGGEAIKAGSGGRAAWERKETCAEAKRKAIASRRPWCERGEMRSNRCIDYRSLGLPGPGRQFVRLPEHFGVIKGLSRERRGLEGLGDIGSLD